MAMPKVTKHFSSKASGVSLPPTRFCSGSLHKPLMLHQICVESELCKQCDLACVLILHVILSGINYAMRASHMHKLQKLKLDH